MSSSDYGQAAVQELCEALDKTFDTLMQMMHRTKSNDSRPASLPTNRKSFSFVHIILKHDLSPSKITDFAEALRDIHAL